jgi:hypothetical protein
MELSNQVVTLGIAEVFPVYGGHMRLLCFSTSSKQRESGFHQASLSGIGGSGGFGGGSGGPGGGTGGFGGGTGGSGGGLGGGWGGPDSREGFQDRIYIPSSPNMCSFTAKDLRSPLARSSVY